MNKIYYFCLLLIIFFFSSCDTIIKYSGKYKDSDAVFLSLTKEYTLDKDGSQLFYQSQSLLYNSYTSINSEYAESHILYDPAFQSCIINKSQTKNFAGSSKEDNYMISEILPESAKGSVYYNRLREAIVTHLSLERGSVVDFEYTIKSNSKYRPALFEKIIIPTSVPIQDYIIRVRVPIEKNLSYHLFNSLVKPDVSERKGLRTYEWHFKNIEQYIEEVSDSKDVTNRPYLVFSTASLSDVKSLFTSKSDESDDYYTKIVKLIKDEASLQESLYLSIQRNLINEVSLTNVSFKEASYKSRPIGDIWKYKSGNLVEKTFLLNKLLLAAGYNSEILVSTSTDCLSYAYTNPDLWTSFYIRINNGDTQVLLSAADRNSYDSIYDLETYKLLNPLNSKEVIIDSRSNRFSADGVISIYSRTNIVSELKLNLSGQCSHEYENINFLKSKIENCTNIFMNKDYSFSCTLVDRTSSERIMDKYFVYRLPSYNLYPDNYNSLTMLSDRYSYLDISSTLNNTYKYKIKVSQQYIPITNDTIINIENSVGKVYINLKSNYSTSRSIDYESHISFKKRFISPAEYKDYKKLVDVWSNNNYKELYFRVNNTPPKKVIRMIRDTTRIMKVRLESIIKSLDKAKSVEIGS